ncbi:MAG: hypothetical protein GXO97_09980 [Nitrospirae bacterium]|nr:hypothetical protein [Nitrospirota bacterium]
MKRLWLILVVFTLIVSYGCKGKEKTEVYSSKEGTVEVKVKKSSSGDVQEMKIKTKEGTAIFKKGKGVIPEDIKGYAYPGASPLEGGSWSMQAGAEKAGKALSSSYLFTKDGIDKVIAYYKDKLKDESPQYYEMTTPNGKMASFTVEKEDKSGVTVMLNEKAGKKGTEIHITKISK